MPLEEHVAFLKQEELTLDDLLKSIPIPNRPRALVPPRLPPYFGTEDRERRSRMIEACADPNGELARMIQKIWIPLFTPPPPPSYIPKEEFMAGIGKAIEQRFADAAVAVEKLRARGGKIVFVRLPVSGGLKQLEAVRDGSRQQAAIAARLTCSTTCAQSTAAGVPGVPSDTT